LRSRHGCSYDNFPLKSCLQPPLTASTGPTFALLSLLLIAGAIVLIFLTLLAGAVNSSATNQIYFLQADTSGIPDAPPTSRWTFWNYCSSDSSSAVGLCDGVHPAYPLDPPSDRTFGTTEGVPPQFIGTRKFFYLTRFMFAFVLIGIFFTVCAFFSGLLALCTRIGAFLSGFLTMIGLFFQMLTAILMR
jgi:SUR7/PalI family